MKKTLNTFITLLTLVGVSVFAGESFSGKVVGVSDGDTITVLRGDKSTARIRLESIDCPEKKQPFGNAAKEFASNLVFGKTVTIVVKETDRYGRLIATVYIGETNLNLELVKAGLAWHYKHYCKSPAFAQAEAEARAAKRGLWSESLTVPPWEYRRRR